MTTTQKKTLGLSNTDGGEESSQKERGEVRQRNHTDPRVNVDEFREQSILAERIASLTFNDVDLRCSNVLRAFTGSGSRCCFMQWVPCIPGLQFFHSIHEETCSCQHVRSTCSGPLCNCFPIKSLLLYSRELESRNSQGLMALLVRHAQQFQPLSITAASAPIQREQHLVDRSRGLTSLLLLSYPCCWLSGGLVTQDVRAIWKFVSHSRSQCRPSSRSLSSRAGHGRHVQHSYAE